jgi:hypothetical protein
MEVENHLGRLLLVWKSIDFTENLILSEVESILIWLNKPENNTNENCRKIDFFIAKNIITDIDYHDITEDTRNILFDLGGQLHDTHTSPETAENFESTPRVLLNRVQNIITNYKNE